MDFSKLKPRIKEDKIEKFVLNIYDEEDNVRFIVIINEKEEYSTLTPRIKARERYKDIISSYEPKDPIIMNNTFIKFK